MGKITILPYDPKVKIEWATPNPDRVVALACSTTQKGVFVSDPNPSQSLIRFLYEAKHGNPLEHAVICFSITDISRACADQLRTHRMTSPTMSSTHYQDHRYNQHRLPLELINSPHFITVEKGIKHSMNNYARMVDDGVLIENARQVLPLSFEVRYMMTINAWSLVHLLRTRLCYRNTIETVLCAIQLHAAAQEWFPNLFDHVSRDCEVDHCREGKMQCDKGFELSRIMKYANY